VIPAAQELDALTMKRVFVVPTRSVPEGVGAVVAYSPQADVEALIPAMTKAAAGVRSGELTRAVRDAATPAGIIREGDWLGLVDGDVRVIAGSRTWVDVLTGGALKRIRLGIGRRRRRAAARDTRACRRALLRMLELLVDGAAEIATIITGADATPEITEAATGWIKGNHRDLVVEVVDGGQPLYPYLVGVE
jgi:dihydroxyacetone kinase-like predicted kinase